MSVISVCCLSSYDYSPFKMDIHLRGSIILYRNCIALLIRSVSSEDYKIQAVFGLNNWLLQVVAAVFASISAVPRT
jgi:hypothetical protein